MCDLGDASKPPCLDSVDDRLKCEQNRKKASDHACSCPRRDEKDSSEDREHKIEPKHPALHNQDVTHWVNSNESMH